MSLTNAKRKYKVSERWLNKDPRFISAMYQYIVRFENEVLQYVIGKLSGMLAYDCIYEIDHIGQAIREDAKLDMDTAYNVVLDFVKQHKIRIKAFAEWRRY